MKDPGVVFFGGPDWDNVAADLRTIPETDRNRFFLCLFMVVLTDQALYTYFPDSYTTWQSRNFHGDLNIKYPKFGWAGFGPHNDEPFELLLAPEREGVINVNEAHAFVPEFVEFFVNETRDYFQQHLPTIDVNSYFDSIKNDPGYIAFDKGEVVRRFKAEFEARTNDQN